MVKMTFARTIKYSDKICPANSTVMVKEEDVEALKKIGGVIIAEDAVVAEAKQSKAAVTKEATAKEKLPPTKGRKRG